MPLGSRRCVPRPATVGRRVERRASRAEEALHQRLRRRPRSGPWRILDEQSSAAKLDGSGPPPSATGNRWSIRWEDVQQGIATSASSVALPDVAPDAAGAPRRGLVAAVNSCGSSPRPEADRRSGDPHHGEATGETGTPAPGGNHPPRHRPPAAAPQWQPARPAHLRRDGSHPPRRGMRSFDAAVSGSARRPPERAPSASAAGADCCGGAAMASIAIIRVPSSSLRAEPGPSAPRWRLCGSAPAVGGFGAR